MEHAHGSGSSGDFYFFLLPIFHPNVGWSEQLSVLKLDKKEKIKINGCIGNFKKLNLKMCVLE
jgi:hypothetical protein